MLSDSRIIIQWGTAVEVPRGIGDLDTRFRYQGNTWGWLNKETIMVDVDQVNTKRELMK